MIENNDINYHQDELWKTKNINMKIIGIKYDKLSFDLLSFQ